MLAVAPGAFAQAPPSVQFHHLYTFGSKYGIHPPRVLNRKLARAALGNAEQPYGLAFPVSVTTDARRAVWITDSGTASIHVFGPNPSTYRQIRRVGDFFLQQPSGIVSDVVGRIFVVDTATGGIFAFDETGDYDRAVVKPTRHVLTAPTAIALSENGRTIYVADPPRNVIVELNREGEVDGEIRLPPEFNQPAALTVIDNQIYVLGAARHKVGIFSPAGLCRGEAHWEGISMPSALAYDAARHHALVANPRWAIVEAFDADGRSLGDFGQYGEAVDQTQRIEAIYVDPQGLVYLVDSHNGKVVVFAEDR